MNDANELDLVAVRAFLGDKLAGFDSEITATKFAHGQSNPTFLIETKAGKYVLRRKPTGILLKSAHAVDREFKVQSALAATPVPVAKMHLLCEDETIIGSAFYVMDHVIGDTYDDPSMPQLSIIARGAVVAEMGRVLAALHNVDPAQVGLADYGAPGDYCARQIKRWSKQYYDSETGAISDMDRLIVMLNERLPQDDGQRTLVHGDYRLDNLIIKSGGTKIRAVLDWELSTLGHPFADLASVIMQWQMPHGAEGRGLAGIDRAAFGLPSDQEFVDRYCGARGIDRIQDFGFYLGFCFFRMAAVLQGVKKRALDGNASNPKKAISLGAHVPAFAAAGLRALKQD